MPASHDIEIIGLAGFFIQMLFIGKELIMANKEQGKGKDREKKKKKKEKPKK
jgi:hypothetical protein